MANERVKYIDFIKGIAIILVVVVHVELFILKRHDIFITVISAIHVPTFIFLSGFFSYKKKVTILFHEIFKSIWSKFNRLIIPFFLFSLLYAIIFKINYFHLFLNNYKYGYWFTFTLFLLYVIYIFTYVFSKGLDIIWKDVVFYICIYSIFLLIFYSHILNDKLLGILSFRQIVYYFPTFMFGVLMKKYFFYFEYLTNHILVLVGSLLTFISCILMYNIFEIDNIPLLVISNISGVYALIHTIKKIENSYLINNKFMNYVGNKSLEIYLIHFFFLTAIKNLLSKHIWLVDFHMINLLYILFFSTVVIILSNLVISFISKSSTLNKILFGKK